MTYLMVRNSYHVKSPATSFLSVLEVLRLALRKIQDNHDQIRIFSIRLSTGNLCMLTTKFCWICSEWQTTILA